MENLFQTFRNTHGTHMQQLDYYKVYTKIEWEYLKRYDQFVEKVKPFMSYHLLDNRDNRNFIRKCPFYRLIWFETEGYDGYTTCGNKQFSN
jgi:hypothetical protein